MNFLFFVGPEQTMYSIESCFDKSIGAIKGFRRKDMSMNGWKSSEIGLRQSESVLSCEMTAENFWGFYG